MSERIDSGLCASDEDSDSKGDPREGKPPSEYIGKKPRYLLRASVVLSAMSPSRRSGFANPRPVASADADNGRWDQQPLLQLGAIRWPGARYNLTL